MYTTIEMVTRKINYLQKNNMENLSRFFSNQIVVPKIRTVFVYLNILIKPSTCITRFTVILILSELSYIYLSPMMKAFNNLGEKKNCECFSMVSCKIFFILD